MFAVGRIHTNNLYKVQTGHQGPHFDLSIRHNLDIIVLHTVEPVPKVYTKLPNYFSQEIQVGRNWNILTFLSNIHKTSQSMDCWGLKSWHDVSRLQLGYDDDDDDDDDDDNNNNNKKKKTKKKTKKKNNKNSWHVV